MIQRVTVTWAPGQAIVDVVGAGQHGLTAEELGDAWRFIAQVWREADRDQAASDATPGTPEANGQGDPARPPYRPLRRAERQAGVKVPTPTP